VTYFIPILEVLKTVKCFVSSAHNIKTGERAGCFSRQCYGRSKAKWKRCCYSIHLPPACLLPSLLCGELCRKLG